MNTRIAITLLALSLGACAGPTGMRVTDAEAPRALAATGPVSVRWADPARFTDIRYSFNRYEAERGDWVTQLAQHIQTGATQRLPAGERLEVEILDIRRAGEYEPLIGTAYNHVRVLREVYSPRMRLHVRRIGADGSVLVDTERNLTDLAYLSGPQPINSTDPLRFEKRMIDRWLQRELAPAKPL